ncbi:MAG TPA: ABC transporter ATP-binding protein [Bryobacteraceae bacterium]|nr:ABC transporter ATP-binding protein [Bryobacteraceae bacterium]
MTSVRFAKRTAGGFTLDVDFPVGPGVTALYGPPGAGKSLTLEAIAGFTRPDSGRILLEDVILFDAASHVHVPPRRRNCGYLAQSDALFPHMTLRQNVAFSARRWPRLERHRRVAEMLEKFRLTDSAGLWPRRLDAQSRLLGAVARALVAEPRLLLLDDCGIGEACLRQIRAATGVPILMVTGSLDLCCAAADQMLILDGGRILQRGAPRQVLDQPQSLEVARLVGIPNLFQATIAALDPGRNSSRLEFDHFALAGPYIPAHFKGNRVWVAAAAENLRVHPGDVSPPLNSVPVQLVRASHHAHSVLVEFSFGIFVNVSYDEFARQQDNKDWQVEFPPEALRVL